MRYAVTVRGRLKVNASVAQQRHDALFEQGGESLRSMGLVGHRHYLGADAPAEALATDI